MLIVKDAVHEPLYAIVPYFNPWRWRSREKCLLRSIKHFSDSGAVVILVEIAFGRCEFAFGDLGLHDTPADCNIHGEGKFKHKHIRLRTSDELWLKENAINLAVAQLPYDWQQICWLDSDVHFLRPNWVGEAIHKLQHYSFLQMFSHARDLGPDFQMLPEDYPHANGDGFVTAFHNGRLPLAKSAPIYYHSVDQKTVATPRVFPGLAWACTREAFDQVGGLIDFAIWGGGDWHMAHALVESQPNEMMRKDLHPIYRAWVNAWRDRCVKHIRRNVGVMAGSIVHHWHGPKPMRGYNTKHALLAEIGFDPSKHLKRDFQGLWQLNDDGTEAFIRLRDAMRVIARERNEDSIDE